MHMLGKKISSSSIVLFICFLTITISTVLVLTNNQRKLDLEKNSRGFYSERAEGFAIGEEIGEDQVMEEALLSMKEKDIIVYRLGLDEKNLIRGVFYNGEVDIPELVEGRYFQEDDFFKGERKAVIGLNCVKDCYEDKGIRFIEINGDEYQVIGVIGIHKKEITLNNMQFINMDAALLAYGEPGSYLIDSTSSKKVEKCFQYFQERFEYNGFHTARDEDTSAVRAFGLEVVDFIYRMLILNFIICSFYITGYWLSKQRQLVGVSMLVGYTKREIFFSVAKRYGQVAVIAYISTMVGYVLYQWVRKADMMDWNVLLLSMIIVLLTAACILILLLIRVIIQPVERMLR